MKAKHVQVYVVLQVRYLGTTSKFDGKRVSLQCKDRAAYPLPPSIFTAEFPSDLMPNIPQITHVGIIFYISIKSCNIEQ